MFLHKLAAINYKMDLLEFKKSNSDFPVDIIAAAADMRSWTVEKFMDSKKKEGFWGIDVIDISESKNLITNLSQYEIEFTMQIYTQGMSGGTNATGLSMYGEKFDYDSRLNTSSLYYFYLMHIATSLEKQYPKYTFTLNLQGLKMVASAKP